MALESATYIAELTITNPVGASDPKSAGDDHIRLLKKTIKNSFGNFAGTAGTPKSVTLTEDQINDAGQKSATQTITGAWTFTGNCVLDAVSTDNVAGVGWKGTPQLDKAIDYTLVLADAGKQIYLSGGASKTLTIPANSSVAFPIGTILIVVNDSGNDWTIAITTDTLEEYGGSTGSQTLTDNNKAVLEKVTSTLWKYSATD